MPAAALAWLVGPGCGSVLVGGDAPVVRELSGTRAEIPVRLPEPCLERSCDYTLTASAFGALIVAARRGPEGETPDWVALGVEKAGVYRFVELWASESSQLDMTAAGPVHALTPHDCGGRLVLVATPRLPGADAEAPAPALRAREGELVLDGDELVNGPRPEGECAAIPIALP
jgi:hypothetical protein